MIPILNMSSLKKPFSQKIGKLLVISCTYLNVHVIASESNSVSNLKRCQTTKKKRYSHIVSVSFSFEILVNTRAIVLSQMYRNIELINGL